mgnify:FL=1
MTQAKYDGPDDPLWYKDAVVYELHIKAFMDGNGDGIGDFAGLTSRLDYLESLGVTAIWLLPFYPSPQKDDGYDIADYFNINPDYGKLSDFKRFLREAHARGLKVITELVLNHTSDQHEWFQRSRAAKPGSSWRNFYVWSDTPDKYREARIIFKDFEHSNWTWDRKAGAYFWHRFYAHQPDLNYDNPRVRKEMLKVLDFWLGMGVDGLRLDAVPYLFERRGTNCENLPETHAFLKELRAHIDSKYKNRMLLAEANQWPEDAVAYFGDGDECHMAYHFPIMPRIFMSLRMEDRFPVIDILEQTPPIPDNAQWAMFLRNHDELTLEMVSDEERDYMYRVYAKDARARINLGIRRRLAPLMENNPRRMELINFILLSFPGAPILYYGDEIGMGDNFHLGDRDGVRTPMQWSPDRNAGFSNGNPHNLYLPVIIDPQYHYEVVNVENQEQNASSLLWWMRRMIALRKTSRALGRGGVVFLKPENQKILSFLRVAGDETVLVTVNLSRHSQVAALDLPGYAGFLPVDMTSNTVFPEIGEGSWVLPMGGHAYFWFRLEKPGGADAGDAAPPVVRVKGEWRKDLPHLLRKRLEEAILPQWVKAAGEAGEKAGELQSLRLLDAPRLANNGLKLWLLLLELDYGEGRTELLPLLTALAEEDKAGEILENAPGAVLCRIRHPEGEAVLHNAFADEEARGFLLDSILKRRRFAAGEAEVAGSLSKKTLPAGRKTVTPVSRAFTDAINNVIVVYENRYFLKFYRHLDAGPHPEIEIVRALTEKSDFPNVPAFAGALEYRPGSGQPVALAMLQNFIPSALDGWTYSLEVFARSFERIFAMGPERNLIPEAPSLRPEREPLLSMGLRDCLSDYYLEMTRVLGARLAELHLALSRVQAGRDFTPEPFSKLYQRAVYQSMRSLVRRTMWMLSRRIGSWSEADRKWAVPFPYMEETALARLLRFTTARIEAVKTRIHGDCHLGQTLYMGNDFMIVDFEGDPRRPMGERRLKRSPLRDAAGMMLSFHFAAREAFTRRMASHPGDATLLEAWLGPMSAAAAASFLRSYLEAARGAPFLPKDTDTLAVMLECFLLEQAFLRLQADLEHGPEKARPGMDCVMRILGDFS